MAKISLNDLNEKHLGATVSFITPFEVIKGRLTDFYGSLDEDDEAIVIIEINEEHFVCTPEDYLEI